MRQCLNEKKRDVAPDANHQMEYLQPIYNFHFESQIIESKHFGSVFFIRNFLYNVKVSKVSFLKYNMLRVLLLY